MLTHVPGADQLGRGQRLAAADRRYLGRRQFSAAAIAGRHRGDDDRVALCRQVRKRPGTLELDVVGVRVNGEHRQALAGAARFRLFIHALVRFDLRWGCRTAVAARGAICHTAGSLVRR
jgi:hypothetical protein